MNPRILAVPLGAVLCTALGLAAGWFAARQEAELPPPTELKGPPEFSPQTLQNLDVTVGPAEPTQFTRYENVAAVVQDTTRTERPVVSVIGGRVTEVLVEPGMVVAPGQVLLRILRTAIPPPTLELTADLLRPAREEIHDAAVELRKARTEVEITERELARVREYTQPAQGGEPAVLPRQREIDLEYQLARQQRAYDIAKTELMQHGLSAKQVDRIAAGDHLPSIGSETWKRALSRNGLWSAAADELFASLPAGLQELPWVVATAGELGARGLISPELMAWLGEDTKAADHFLELGVLLQQGHTVADLRVLEELDAFHPVLEVRAPAEAGVPDWDVRSVHVRPGAEIATGSALLTLANPRRLWLRTEVAGSEAQGLLRVLQSGGACTARPLVRGSGPEHAGLVLSFVRGEPGHGHTVGYLEVDNEPLSTVSRDDVVRRTWQLRDGLRYMLQIPVDIMENVYVLPSGAVTPDGADQLVLRADDHGHYEELPVRVLYRDEQVVVVANDDNTPFEAGELLVQTGAFALHLALHGAEEDAAHAHVH